jgi:hypothetical protein
MRKILASSIKTASKLNINLLLPTLTNQRLLHKNNAATLDIQRKTKETK